MPSGVVWSFAEGWLKILPDCGTNKASRRPCLLFLHSQSPFEKFNGQQSGAHPLGSTVWGQRRREARELVVISSAAVLTDLIWSDFQLYGVEGNTASPGISWAHPSIESYCCSASPRCDPRIDITGLRAESDQPYSPLRCLVAGLLCRNPAPFCQLLPKPGNIIHFVEP